MYRPEPSSSRPPQRAVISVRVTGRRGGGRRAVRSSECSTEETGNAYLIGRWGGSEGMARSSPNPAAHSSRQSRTTDADATEGDST